MTVLDYLTDSLHLSPERAAAHLQTSGVRLYRGDDYRVIADGSREIEEGEKVVFQPAPPTDET